ncbi:DNA-binding GntR family transcriptional regulator [Mesorhizobium soli]|uniref:GntR family transcriptional regulator n=1 Tax=Pseudaminobacter soli (ex Li et al. 2025) TaxID=1295366 RepID=UPI002476F65E|nr:GntR family transcriptional regulator [Mesorhizobium soli]MDH6234593.1 DNA-binding GntR family transcriptional regulator [Mesorhizobium soli]
MTTTTSLARDAHQRIIGMILEGVLKPGDALQEASLGEALGMSRTPVREAIKRIESEGLAATEGRFTRVRQLGAAEIEEIFFLRLELEPICARAAAATPPSGTDEIEARIRVLMADGPEAAPDDVQWHIDSDLHGMIARAAGNRTVADVIAGLHRRTCIFDHTQVPERFLKGCEEHLEILQAIRLGDGAAAEAAMARHLTHARDAIFARLHQIQIQP